MGFLSDLVGIAAPIVGTAIGGPVGGAIGGLVGKTVAGAGKTASGGGGTAYAQAGGLTTPGAVSQGTVQSLPDWYNNYAKTMTNNGLGILQNLPSYSGYTDALGNPAPMVAGLSGTQQKGLDTLKAGIGSWKGGLQQAQGTLDSANPMFGNASGAYGKSMGTIDQGLGTVDKAMSTFGTGQNQINAASGALSNMGGALQTASGLINPAQTYMQNGTNGSEFSSDKMSQYMNPYTTNVNNEIARLGNQNLMENVLPGVNSTFTGNGQFGSTRNGDFVARAIRDNQATISGQQAKVLADAQAQALGLANNASDRNLQAGAQTGQLAGVATGIAGQYGNQANTQINQGQATAGIGQGQLGAAGQQFSAAQDQQQAGAGFNNVGNSMVNLGQAQGALTQAGQQMNLNDSQALMNAGAVEQATNQKGMDAAYKDFLDQRDYPLQAMGALSQILPNVSGRVDGNTQSMTLNSANAPQPVSPYQAYANILGGLSVASMGAQ